MNAEDAQRALWHAKKEHAVELNCAKKEGLKERQDRVEREQAYKQQLTVVENNLELAKTAELGAVEKLDMTEN